jgi:hypothetical protein
VALPFTPTTATVFSHDGKTGDVPVTVEDGRCRLDLAELPLYSIVVLSDGTRTDGVPAAGATRDEDRS